MDPYRSVILSSAHYKNGDGRSYVYHVLLSPFQMPQSRLDEVIPGGKIAKGDSMPSSNSLGRGGYDPANDYRESSRSLHPCRYKPASALGTSETLGNPAAMVVSITPVRRSKRTLSSDAI